MGRTRWLLAAPKVRTETEGEAAFDSLKGEVDRNQQPKSVRAPWISKETWRLAYQRAEIQRAGQVRTRRVHKAQRYFQRAL